MQREQSYGSFKIGAPSGFQMLEASLLAAPENTKILAALAKGYNAYATTVGETESFLNHEQTDSNPRQSAIDHHTLAISRARDFLKKSGVTWSTDLVTLQNGLRNHQHQQEVIDIAFIASHSLKSLIALQRGKPVTLTFAPIADALSQFACEGAQRPSYPTWACDAMKAVESAEKPSVAGGSLDESRRRFLEIFKQKPASLMPMALWAQHGLTKRFNRDDWSMIKEALNRYHSSRMSRQVAIATSDTPPAEDEEGLINAAAARRLEFMAKHESDLF
jgi:hypothetical protein